MTTRQLVRAARVANATLDGWLADAVVEMVDGRIASVGRAGDLPSDIAATHEVHDLGDVSLLPGFVETHIHMHFPAAPDYREIARPEPVERSIIRATEAMRRLLLSGATTARDTGSRDGRGTRDPVGGARRRHPRAAAAGRRGADHDDRRPLLVPRRRGRHDRRRRRARARAKKAGVDAIKVMASGGGYTPTSNPRSEQYGARHAARPPSPRRIGWGCRSWPIR